MRKTRITAAIASLSLLAALTACGDDEGETNTTPTANGSTSVRQDVPKHGDVEPPKAVDAGSLPAANAAQGLVLVQQDENGGCVILTYAGELKKLGTFPAFTAEHKSRTQQCHDRGIYTSDFRTRVGVIYANYTGPNDFDKHVVVQQIGQAEKDITGDRNLGNPTVGPDDKLYVEAGKGLIGTLSVMNLDGTDLKEVPNGKRNPAWLGGKMVKNGVPAVSNPDGSLAVEYISARKGYRVGSVPGNLSGPAIDGKVVLPASGEASKPLAWVGESGFLTVNGGAFYLNTIDTSGEKPTVTVKPAGVLPQQYMTVAPAPVNKAVVNGDTAYFTIAMPSGQGSVILSLNVTSGEFTALAQLKNHTVPGTTYYTEVVGYVK